VTGRRQRGELKAALLRVLRGAEKPMTARELRIALEPDVPAMTTVLTVLDRMRVAGEVERFDRPGENLYASVKSDSRYTADAMLTALLDSSDRGAALLRFAGDLDESDAEALRAALRAAGRERAVDGSATT